MQQIQQRNAEIQTLQPTPELDYIKSQTPLLKVGPPGVHQS